MKQPLYLLDEFSRAVVLRAILESRTHKDWKIMAVHVRQNHVHVVVKAQQAPEEILNHFKSYASRSLNRLCADSCGRLRWARHGSTRYLWKPKQVRAAIEYVVHGQGEAMAVWHSADMVEYGTEDASSNRPLPPGRGSETA